MGDYVLLNAIVNRLVANNKRLRRCCTCLRWNSTDPTTEKFDECWRADGRSQCHYEPSRWVEDDGPGGTP